MQDAASRSTLVAMEFMLLGLIAALVIFAITRGNNRAN